MALGVDTVYTLTLIIHIAVTASSSIMPVSLEDLMEFLQKEKAERAVERAEDKKELMAMISLGVKKEVEASMGPVQERQAVMEKEQ